MYSSFTCVLHRRRFSQARQSSFRKRTSNCHSLVRRRSRLRRLRYLCLFIFNRRFFRVLLASMMAGTDSSSDVPMSQRRLQEELSHGVISSSLKCAAIVSDAGAAVALHAGILTSTGLRKCDDDTDGDAAADKGAMEELDVKRRSAVIAALLRNILPMNGYTVRCHLLRQLRHAWIDQPQHT